MKKATEPRNWRLKGQVLIALLLSCVALETWIAGHDAKSGSPFIPIIYFLSGLGIALLPLFRQLPAWSAGSTKSQWAARILLMLLCVAFGAMAVDTFHQHPIDYRQSDVLTVLDILASRFIRGEPVYEIITELWGGTRVIYMPGMWLPFVLPTYFDFDARWLTTAALCISALVAFRWWEQNPGFTRVGVAQLPLVVCFALLIFADNRLIIFSQESVIILYYVVLGYAVLTRQPWMAGGAAALCATSRYALAFWLIAFLVFLVFIKEYRFLLRAFVAASVVSLFLIIPTGAIDEIQVFLGLDDVYLNAVRPNNEWKMTATLYQGCGLVRFWEYDNLKSFYKLFLVVSSVTPFAAFFVLYRKEKSYNGIAALCILKLSLVVFYNFLLIPVHTLFFTSNFLSYLLLYAVMYPPTRHSS